jgi:long-chain acyl-CoA synthetase
MGLWDQAERDPGGLALDDFERTRSWGELVERATRVAHLLRDGFGLRPGDHAAMLMGNRVEFVELAVGSILAGVWMTPINWHLVADEVRYIVEDSGAGVLFADPTYADTARAATGRPVLVAGDDLDDALASASAAAIDQDGPAGGTMLYTSGTTGRPKGVKRPRSSTIAATLAADAAPGTLRGLVGGGPHLVTGPLYHSAPIGFSNIDFHNGAPLLLMATWDPRETLRIMQERQVRNSHLVPTMFVRLLRLPDEERAAFDPSSLHTIIHGAAPIAPQVKQRMIEWWGPVLLEYWGSTEGGVFTIVGSEDWLSRPGTVGRAIPTYEVFAVDEDGAPLGPGEIGTLYTRNLVTKEVFEYHQAPEKTAGAHLEPGVFTMGDVGHVDADGFVYLSDRAANMIISGGVNIYPAEIEQVLIDHPAVADVAVFGIPDEEWGEQVKAAVELAEGYEPSPDTEAEIIAFARGHLAGYKVPRSVDFHDQLPRHPTGKLYTRLLRDRYWKGESKFI